MAGSLLDFGEIAQRAQQQVRDAIGMQNMQTHQSQVENERVRLQQEDRRMTQQSVFRGFDEIEKLMKAPQFSTPERQLGLRVTQANLLKNGLGLKDMDLPSEEELRGGMDQFADNLRLFRHGATLPERQAAFERLAISMPDYGLKILEAQKEAGELDTQGEELRLKLDTKKAELKAMNLKYSRASIQQGMFSEHLGAMAQPLQLLDNPEFQPHIKNLQGMNDLARQAYLKRNPEFVKSFERAMKPHLEMYGAVGQEFESVLGDDVQPRMLTALDDAITNKRKSRQEVFDRDGEIPLELDEELSGMELVRKARKHQYNWMRDPFNKDKLNAMRKAQQDMKIAADVAGKTMGGVEDARTALAQTKFTAEQQEKKAEDYAQDRKLFYLNSGHNETKAAFLASQDTRKEFPDTSYGADKLQPKKPLVDLKLNTSQTASEEAAKDFMKETRQTYNQLKQAPTLLNNIEKAKELVPLAKGFMGTGGEGLLEAAKFFNNRLGAKIDVTGVKSAEELRTRIFFNVMDSLKKLDSQPSQTQQARLEDALGKLGTDPSAVHEILDAFGDVIREKIDIHNNEVSDARKNGVVFPYNPTVSAPAKRQAQQAQPSTSPSGKAQPQGGAVLKSLPQGAKQVGTYQGKPIFESPDGKRWQKKD